MAIKVGQWIKDHMAYGPMGHFRTKNDDGQWKKGKIFSDDQKVIVVHVGKVAEVVTAAKEDLDSDTKTTDGDGSRLAELIGSAAERIRDGGDA